MNKLFELTIVRKKLVIKMLKRITIDDLIPVRETLNSIDFIFGNEDKWEYKKLNVGWIGTTKVRLDGADELLKFMEANKDKINFDSVDRAFISDIAKVFHINVNGKEKKTVVNMDKEDFAKEEKKKFLVSIEEAIDNLNEIAQMMGDIL